MKFPTLPIGLILLLGALSSCGAGQSAGSTLPFPEQIEGMDQEVLARFQEARDALALAPEAAAAWMHLGMTYEAHSYMRLAIESYRAANLREPAARSWHRLAIALASEGELEAAAAAIVKSIELQADYAPSHLLHGAYLFDQGLFDEAYAAYQKAQQADAGHLGSAVGLARVELQRGNPELAIELLLKNLELRSTEPTTRRLLHTAYLHAGRSAEAEDLGVKWHSFRSLGADPWAKEFAAYGAPPLMELAGTLIARGKGEEAAELLEPFVRAHPDENNACAHLAHAYHLSGRSAQALELLEAALENSPQDLLLLASNAYILESMGKYPAALALTGAMLEIDPTHLDCLESRGRIYRRMGKPGGAIKAYQRVLKLDRSRMEIWLALGNVQLDAELWKPASESFSQALALKPGAEAPFIGAQHAKWKRGQLEAAIGQLMRRKKLSAEGRLLLQQMQQAREEGS